MKIILKLKLLLYRFFNTGLGNLILKILSIGIRVKNIGNSRNKNNYPFLIAITIDTEAGYVGNSERRIWQMENPNAFVGYHGGIRNLASILRKYNVKATFLLSTQCFSSSGRDYTKIKKEIYKVLKYGHEIGLHIHPDSDFSIQKKLSKKFEASSAFFYNYDEKLSIIKSSKMLLEEHLGKNIINNIKSFRWGNWALDAGGAKALNKLGFLIDSSATPGIKGHLYDGMKYDWNNVKTNYPWKLSITNHQATTQNNSNITEMPIATFDFFITKLRADPVYSVLLNKAFDEYYKKADRSHRPFPFVVITHSCEATTKYGKPTNILKDLEKFIIFASSYENVQFVTLRKAHDMLIM